MGINVLVVDDSATSRTYILKNLQVSGVSLGEQLEAKNGKEALTILTSKKIDIMFLDINMPIMTGLELAQELNKIGILPQLPIIMISSEGTGEKRVQLEHLGVRKFIRKPFTPELFSNLISEVLGTGGNAHA